MITEDKFFRCIYKYIFAFGEDKFTKIIKEIVPDVEFVYIDDRYFEITFDDGTSIDFIIDSKNKITNRKYVLLYNYINRINKLTNILSHDI